MVVVANLPPPPVPAVSAALTTAKVQVTSGFKGARIVVYGAVFNPGVAGSDVVVIVRGPNQPVRIARKVHIAGLWLNSRPVVFQGAPGFYMTASTKPLDQIADFGVLRRLGAGIDHLTIAAPAEQRIETRYGVRDMVVSSLGADYLDWRRAVIRLKQKSGLYDADSAGVVYVDKGLFKSEIDLPTDAPIGNYKVQILLLQGGQLVSERRRDLTIEKVGFERALYVFAHSRPWSYGVVSVLIALAAGWAASAAFRRA